MFIRQLPKCMKLELYKRIKGYFLFESGVWNLNKFKHILDEKVNDVYDALDYDFIDYMAVYREYSYGAWRY